ncbi:MAG: hypothetical protein AWU56_351 [Idiomarina sp. T82-3]|nr:MAG: hypothetical protein AWU56_351 [Idiomarina sp. T82-3]
MAYNYGIKTTPGGFNKLVNPALLILRPEVACVLTQVALDRKPLNCIQNLKPRAPGRTLQIDNIIRGFVQTLNQLKTFKKKVVLIPSSFGALFRQIKLTGMDAWDQS